METGRIKNENFEYFLDGICEWVYTVRIGSGDGPIERVVNFEKKFVNLFFVK